MSRPNALPVVVGRDGKARLRPPSNIRNHRSSLDVSRTFPGFSSLPKSEADRQSKPASETNGPSREEKAAVDDDLSPSDNSSISSLVLNGGENDSLGNGELPENESLRSSSRSSSISQRSNAIRNSVHSRNEERRVSASRTPRQYADELRRHSGEDEDEEAEERRSPSDDPSLRRRSKEDDDDDSLRLLLRRLREDLESSSSKSFVDEFSSPPIDGLSLLIRILEAKTQTNKKDSKNKDSLRRPKEVAFTRDVLTLELRLSCLDCLRQIVHHRHHLNRLLDDERAVQAVLSCSLFTGECDSRIAATQLLTMICEGENSFAQLIKALSRAVFARQRQEGQGSEFSRFSRFVRLLEEATNVEEEATIVRFLNSLWKSAPDLSAKLFLQQELNFADFRPEILSLRCSSLESDERELLQPEVDAWTENYIDDSKLISISPILEPENNKDTPVHQTQQLQDLLKESESKRDLLEEKTRQLEEQREAYRERVKELQNKVQQFRILYHDRTGRDADNDSRSLKTTMTVKSSFDSVQRNFAKHRQLRFSTMGYSQAETFSAGGRPLSPSFLRQTIRLKLTSHQQLPQLNWTPMNAVGSTIFEDMDIEGAVREMDFSDLERVFQLPLQTESVDAVREKAERLKRKNARKINFVENNRAKNLVITQRKTGLSPVELKSVIDACDVSSLPGEIAEMLLRYTPTREELQQIATHSDRYEDFGDAEKILLQMSRVERLETKLSAMVFIGSYVETISQLKPDIETLTKASQSVIESERLKGLLEVILVYGNYMNCTRRGCALGFKLDSLSKLSDVKSQDKSLTLLHHLQSVLLRDFPLLATFYEDLSLENIASVSKQAIDEEIVALRKGIEIVSEEMQHQPNNLTLSKFYEDSASEIDSLDEPYREMIGCYRVVCNLFGENSRIAEPAELFGHLVDFIAAFKKAASENFTRLNLPQNTKYSENQQKFYNSSPIQVIEKGFEPKINSNLKAEEVAKEEMKSEVKPQLRPVVGRSQSIAESETKNPKAKRMTSFDVRIASLFGQIDEERRDDDVIMRTEEQSKKTKNDRRKIGRVTSLVGHSFYYAAVVKRSSQLSNESTDNKSTTEEKLSHKNGVGPKKTKDDDYLTRVKALTPASSRKTEEVDCNSDGNSKMAADRLVTDPAKDDIKTIDDTQSGFGDKQEISEL